MSDNGIVIVTATLDKMSKQILAGPEILTRGFIYVKENIDLIIGKIHSSDVFYGNVDFKKLYNEKKCLAAEMESFALFHNAKILNKKATCLLTVSDNLATNEKISSEERQKSFNEMIKLALDSVL